MLRLLPIIGLLLVAMPGCMSSRWAMDDPDYSGKYSRPYGPDVGKKAVRMAKQSVDARHVAQKGGIYTAGIYQRDPSSVGGEIGVFSYPVPFAEGHVGIMGIGGTAQKNLFLGLNGGVRVQTPTRIAPFAGVGAFGGFSAAETMTFLMADENDPMHDHYGYGYEDETNASAIAGIYPELGVHCWLTSRLRISGSASCYVTTTGREHDSWAFGLTLSRLVGH